MWRTASGLSALAAVATVLVSVIGLIATLGDDDAPTRAIPSGVGVSNEQTPPSDVPPALTRTIFSDSLEDASSGFEAFPSATGCSSAYEGHYHVGVDVPEGDASGPFCIERSRVGELEGLEHVRVEVTARWIELPPRDYGDAGRSAVGLTCYSSGLADSGTHYEAIVTTNGTWAIDRQFGGDDTVDSLDRGRRSDGWTMETGDLARLRLDCWAQDDGVFVEFWVDGQRLGRGFDPEPLPPSGIGLLVWGFSEGRAEAEFSDLVVYGDGATA